MKSKTPRQRKAARRSAFESLRRSFMRSVDYQFEARRMCDRLRECGVPTELIPLQYWMEHDCLRLRRLPEIVRLRFIGAFVAGLAKASIRVQSDPSACSKEMYLRVRSTFRFLIRLLDQHEDGTTTSQIWDVLQQPASRWQQGLLAVSRESDQRLRQRMWAAASADEVAEYLGGFMNYTVQVIGGNDPPAYRFDAGKKTDRFRTMREFVARTEITASNNGHMIKLPSWVAATGDPELNQLFYLYLMGHELLHTLVGSFDFSWRTARGRMIKRRLWCYKKEAQKNSASTKARRAWRNQMLRAEGFTVELRKLPSTPLVQFFESFGADASLMRTLVNGLEDGRLERTIENRLNGLHQIHQQVQATYSKDVMSSPQRMSDEARLINAIGFYSARRPWQEWVPEEHKKTFDEARTIIQRAHERPKQSLYDSLLTAMDLYDLLKRFFASRWADQSAQDDPNQQSGSGLGRGRKNSESMRSITEELGLLDDEEDIDSASMRHALSVMRGGKWDDTDDTDRLESDPKFSVEKGGVWLPELTNKGLVEKIIHLTVKGYANKTPPIDDRLEPLDYPFPRLVGPRALRNRSGIRYWHRDGDQLADERFAEYYAAVYGGDDGYLVTYDRLKTTSEMFVTIILDAAVSIEAKRTSLGGNSSLQRMLQMGSWLAQGLESQGVRHEAFAGISGGVRLVQLHQLTLPLSYSIHGFRALGAGGFRLGAMLRAVSSKRSELELPRTPADHRIIVMTDGDEKYVNLPAESLFKGLHRNNCPMCTTRHRCLITHARGGMDQRMQSRDLYGSSSHALKDIRHAIDGSAGAGRVAENKVLILAFSDAMTVELWDQHLGNRWVKSISSKLAAREVSRFLEMQPVLG